MNQSFIFSIDVGGTTCKLAIVTIDGRLVEKWDIPTNAKNKGKYIIDEIHRSFLQKLQKLNLPKKQFIGIGMGVPGPVLHGSIITRAVNIGWENLNIKKEMEEKFSMPAFIANDANCAALGELWLGAGAGFQDIVCITLGTGVGGGVVINGRLLEGFAGGGGEIGHITVQWENGFPCNCGKNGCLETVASGTGIVRLAKAWLKKNEKPTALSGFIQFTAKDIFELAAQDDEVALEIVDQAAFYLGYALGTLSTVLNPEAFIIGGGVSNAGRTLLDPVQKYARRFAFPSTYANTKIYLAQLGNDAGIFGAGYLVKSHFDNESES